MRFYISKATASTAGAQMVSVIRAVSAVTGEQVDPELGFNPEFTSNEFANYSVNTTQDEIVVEVNDEVLLRYMTLYVRVVTTLAPIVQMATGLVKLLDSDVNDLRRFIHMRK